MQSIRLRKDQIKRMAKGLGSRIINTAVKRYHSNSLVIQNELFDQEELNVSPLEVFAIRNKPKGLTDKQIRLILDAHYANPLDFSDEIRRLDQEIDNLFKIYGANND